MDRDLPSAKKARLTPKALSSSEKGFIVCEDADIVSKGEIPSATRTIPIPNASRDFVSVVSDKENQSETKSMENWNSGKLGGLGKERKVVSWHLSSSLPTLILCRVKRLTFDAMHELVNDN